MLPIPCSLLALGAVQSSCAAQEGNSDPRSVFTLEFGALDRFSDIGLLCKATDVIPFNVQFGSCRFPRSGDVLNILDVYISRTFLMALEIISFFHVFAVTNLQTAIRSPEILSMFVSVLAKPIFASLAFTLPTRVKYLRSPMLFRANAAFPLPLLTDINAVTR